MRIAAGLFVVLVVGSISSQEVIKEPPRLVEPNMDSGVLQGTWDLDQLEIAGKKIAADEVKKTRARIIIAGSEITFLVDPDKKGSRGTFTLDGTKSPRWITVEDAKKGKELGIYEVRGDTLKWCSVRTGGERPGEFVSKAMPDSTLLVFKRAATPEKVK